MFWPGRASNAALISCQYLPGSMIDDFDCGVSTLEAFPFPRRAASGGDSSLLTGHPTFDALVLARSSYRQCSVLSTSGKGAPRTIKLVSLYRPGSTSIAAFEIFELAETIGCKIDPFTRSESFRVITLYCVARGSECPDERTRRSHEFAHSGRWAEQDGVMRRHPLNSTDVLLVLEMPGSISLPRHLFTKFSITKAEAGAQANPFLFQIGRPLEMHPYVHRLRYGSGANDRLDDVGAGLDVQSALVLLGPFARVPEDLECVLARVNEPKSAIPEASDSCRLVLEGFS